MKEEENVASEAVPGAAAQEADRTEYGKFGSADALLRAYESLEAEFTRRSQRLKELEGRNKEEKPPEAGQAEPPSAEGLRAERTSEELYRAVTGNESVRARVLSDYLASLRGVPLMGGSGAGVSAPAVRPKSIAEAGALALGYFKNTK